FARSSELPNPGADWHIEHVADFNGDGLADLLWRSHGGPNIGRAGIWIAAVDPDSGRIGIDFASSAEIGAPTPGQVMATHTDFDGDGRADILWRNTDGRVAIWRMEGAIVDFASSGELPNPGSDWQIMQAADITGDGRADLVWRNDTSGDVAFWRMVGATPDFA